MKKQSNPAWPHRAQVLHVPEAPERIADTKRGAEIPEAPPEKPEIRKGPGKSDHFPEERVP